MRRRYYNLEKARAYANYVLSLPPLALLQLRIVQDELCIQLPVGAELKDIAIQYEKKKFHL